MSITSIQWTDRTVNPIRARNKATGAVGHFCEKVSPGCAHCYASDWNERVRPSGKHLIGTGLAFDVRNRDQIEFFLDDSKLLEVLKRRQPTQWFWCDMTDMFVEWVPDEWIDRCFAVMALTPQHTHQVLTKRADRMRDYVCRDVRAACVAVEAFKACGESDRGRAAKRANDALFRWPLQNVWIGVSVEDQKHADERIPLLLQTPAAVRFISAEPLLGRVDLERVPIPAPGAGFYGLRGVAQPLTEKDSEPDDWKYWTRHGAKLDWVIVGGESGPGARPFDLAWARSIVQQCKAAGVACFYKQGGASNACQHDRKGGCMDCAPADLRVREFPRAS